MFHQYLLTYFINDLWYLINNEWYLINYVWCLINYSWYPINYIWYLINYACYIINYSWHIINYSFHLVNYSWCFVNKVSSLQGFGRKIQSISQIFHLLLCSTLQLTVVIPILVFLSSICPVLGAAFDLFSSRRRPKLREIT